MVELEFYDPSGQLEITRNYAKRLSTLAGKKIAMLSGDQWQAHRTLPVLKQLLERDFPGIEVIPADTFPKGEFAVGAETTIEMVKNAGVDAVIIGNAACGSCSTALARAAARFEDENIPTVLLGRTDFLGVVRNAMAGMGLPGEAAVVDFSVDLFMPESDLSAVERRKEEFYRGLIDWRPVARQGSGAGTAMIRLSSASDGEAFVRANELMLTNRWGDGLPVIPPTPDRVAWIMSGTDEPREKVLGKVLPRGGIATIEACAIALAMAGGRPEYLPVLIAIMEAFLDPLADSEHMQADSAGAFPVVIVNGPIAKEIRLNTGFGCLGPDPQRPAGASIGRALRFIQQNLGGALPGVGAMAMWGAMRYTNAIFGEDEASLPEGWLPHGTERHGFLPGENSVSLFWATGVANVRRRSGKRISLEDDIQQGLLRMAEYVATPNLGALMGWSNGTPGAMMLSPVAAKAMAGLGWTKDTVRRFLWENSRLPQNARQDNGINDWIEVDPVPAVRESAELDQWPWSSSPDNIILLVSGGGHPTNSHWLQGYSLNVVGRRIALPQNYFALLSQADRDIGSGGDGCQI